MDEYHQPDLHMSQLTHPPTAMWRTTMVSFHSIEPAVCVSFSTL